MGCIANQTVPKEKIPLSIIGPILLIGGAVGLFVDYLSVGTHSAWWYAAAIVVGIAVSVRGSREWRKHITPEAQTLEPTPERDREPSDK